MVAVAVVVPTLHAGEALDECLASLERQTFRDFEVIVVDNSGKGLVRYPGAIRNERNVGFGAAINQGWRRSAARFVATLNDDAVACEGWLAALVQAMNRDARVGMCASQVRLKGTDRLDSAGMLMARDGSSKQRGHGESVSRWPAPSDALFPSGSAAMYRRAMLEETGGFEESYFLYCEDTDLGLRARWAGWRCVYVPEAVVEHRYSHSAGRASALKAYLVERNRLWTVVRNFPLSSVPGALAASLVRYLWHAWYALHGSGVTGEYARSENPLALLWLVVRAHLSTLVHLPELLRGRRSIRRTVSAREFLANVRQHSISLKQVASL